LRIGSISQGKTKCDHCGQTVPYAGRYLIVREKKGVENEEGTPKIYCVKCARQKKYTAERKEKGTTIMTFFKDAIGPHAHRVVDETPDEIVDIKEPEVEKPEDADASAEDDTEE
jgi:hypothetical protein